MLTENQLRTELAALSAQEILEYISLAQQIGLELLAQRGMDSTELRARRKAILSAEIDAIDAELKREGIILADQAEPQ